MTLRLSLLVTFALLAARPANSADPWSGAWHNELRSQIKITVGAKGVVTGKYCTVVGQVPTAAWFDVSGSTNENVITFFVNWGAGAKSITTWLGHYTNDKSGPHILTLWHLGRQSKEDRAWDGTLAGADNFEPGPPTNGPCSTPPPS